MPFHHERTREENKILDFTATTRESYNEPFSKEEFLSALSACNDSAPGLDNITYSMIKHLPRETQKFLLSIVNKIWKENSFPSTWDTAIVLSFLKPLKDGANVSNYRPIALTSCICKIMEKMVNSRLIWVLERKGLLNPSQCGFLLLRSLSRLSRSVLPLLFSIFR